MAVCAAADKARQNEGTGTGFIVTKGLAKIQTIVTYFVRRGHGSSVRSSRCSSDFSMPLRLATRLFFGGGIVGMVYSFEKASRSKLTLGKAEYNNQGDIDESK
jgi:hypothetical protein